MNDRELRNVVNYLLTAQLNLNASPLTGDSSNQRLRALFMELVEAIQPAVFFDIGARDGESAVEVKKRQPHCRTYAFEANPEIFARYTEGHSTLGQVDYRHLAMSNVCGAIELFVPALSSEVMVGDEIIQAAYVETAGTGRSSILPRTDAGAQYKRFAVPASTLDQFCLDEQITSLTPTVAWIDVEGAASLVIEGARQTLRSTALVFVEVEGHAFWQGQAPCHSVIDTLMEMGFVPVARDREYYDKQFNVLLMRPEHLHHMANRLYDMKSVAARVKNSAETVETAGLKAVEEQDAVRAIAPTTPAAAHVPRLVPILVPVFNNPTFLRRMLTQLSALGYSNITILDNASTYPPMLEYLDALAPRFNVVRLGRNVGPRHAFMDAEFYRSLPQVFCLTDPDLDFNEEMPADFVDRLYALSMQYRVGKVGLALRIDDKLKLRQEPFQIGDAKYRIAEWEAQFWRAAVAPDVYNASIDTTFALYNKAFFDPKNPLAALRVAGTLACVHLPWLEDFQLPEDEVAFYRQSNRHSFYLPNAELGPPAA